MHELPIPDRSQHLILSGAVLDQDDTRQKEQLIVITENLKQTILYLQKQQRPPSDAAQP